MATRLISSPIGPVELKAEGGALVALTMLRKSTRPKRPSSDDDASPEDTAVLDQAERQLGEYFAGKRTRFDLPLNASGTPFRKRVWRALSEIPHGELRTYGELAARLKTAPRAVGGACGANPIGIIVPCHRVVGGHGAIGGFSGGEGCDTKRVLLALEGRADLFDKNQSHKEIA
jgi:methylated-DNA-[protein]-cysteine S-methyltransferase